MYIPFDRSHYVHTPPAMDDDKTPEATPIKHPKRRLERTGRRHRIDTMDEMDDDRDETTADEDEDEDESIESERSIDRSRLDS